MDYEVRELKLKLTGVRKVRDTFNEGHMRTYLFIGTPVIIGASGLVYLTGGGTDTVIKCFLASVALWSVVALLDRWLL